MSSISVILGLHEGVGDLFAAVDGADEDEEGAANDDEAEGSSRFVSVVICAWCVSDSIEAHTQGGGWSLLLTSDNLVDIIQHQVHERIIALQRSLDCTLVSTLWQHSPAQPSPAQPGRKSSSYLPSHR